MRRSAPCFKIRHDPRVTRVGRVIRKLSIDELPQLVNVVRGEMSLVGPRPPLPTEVDQYEPWQRKRFEVLPGITGLAQISGRSDLAFAEVLRLDFFYIENWSPLSDIKNHPQDLAEGCAGEGRVLMGLRNRRGGGWSPKARSGWRSWCCAAVCCRAPRLRPRPLPAGPFPQTPDRADSRSAWSPPAAPFGPGFRRPPHFRLILPLFLYIGITTAQGLRA